MAGEVMTRGADYLAAFAAALGAAGVTLAAASAHGGGGDFGRTAAQFCLVHSTALLAVAASARTASERRCRRLLLTGGALAFGTALFCVDLAKLAFGGNRLFAYAAPMGGFVMIASWLALVLVFAIRE